MFEPGQKVVCVNDAFGQGIRDIFNALPVKGRTYTVRDIVPGWDFAFNEQPAVYLTELVNLPNEHGFEPGFACFRFRELDTDPADEMEEVSKIIQFPRVYEPEKQAA